MIARTGSFSARARKGIYLWIALCVCVLLSSLGVAQTLPTRPAILQWDASAEQLLLSVSYRDVADAELLRKLRVGLPTTLVMMPVSASTRRTRFGQVSAT